MQFRNILVTGGAGYVGAALIPRLLEAGCTVTVVDLMIYGLESLSPHPRLEVVKGDIRDQALLRKVLPGHDAVIHLACISNDPSFELNPDLGKSINLDSFRPLAEISRDSGVARFIYASSSSVYGIKKETDVHEEMELEPLTDYSRFKADCEEILLQLETSEFSGITVRPATVCGYSRRQRLDVVVNILTNMAYHKREVTIFGGNQLRPNIHISDMVGAYIKVLDAPKEVVTGKIYNVGYENQPVKDLASIVKEVVGPDVELITKPTNDNRSYHISSRKILEDLDFKAENTIRDAVVDLVGAFNAGKLPNAMDDDKYFNIRRMQSIQLS
jgi:nucleoside-diphosphate-sugar epimerase